MPAAYDTYDYPSYWKGREYEHASEVIVLKHFLSKIKKIDSLIDIGAGYGRLTSIYLHRAKKIILADPSSKLLSLAKRKIQSNKITFLHSTLINLDQKIPRKKFNVVILVRVVHHLNNIDHCFKIINKITKKNGYFILEFPNKLHLKKTYREFLKGNFTFPIDIFPKDIRNRLNIKKKTLPFINYHPHDIIKKLEDNGFEIIEKRSVSNLRLPILKLLFPLDLIVGIEHFIQNHSRQMCLGPSIFVLAQKKHA